MMLLEVLGLPYRHHFSGKGGFLKRLEFVCWKYMGVNVVSYM